MGLFVAYVFELNSRQAQQLSVNDVKVANRVEPNLNYNIASCPARHNGDDTSLLLALSGIFSICASATDRIMKIEYETTITATFDRTSCFTIAQANERTKADWMLAIVFV